MITTHIERLKDLYGIKWSFTSDEEIIKEVEKISDNKINEKIKDIQANTNIPNKKSYLINFWQKYATNR